MLGWCDNGLVDGKFTEGLVYSILTSDLPIVSAMRVQGNQIGRQRDTAFDMWHTKTKFEWVLWVDSDIVLTNDALKKVWDLADAKERPVVSGTYFISKENEQTLMTPYPALFLAHESSKYIMSYIHPLPPDQAVKVDYAGFGFLLMHRSVGDKLRSTYGNKPLFMETSESIEPDEDTESKFIGEDIQFFMKMRECGIPLYAHTGAVVKHMKRFAFDYDFYKLYWGAQILAQEQAQKKAEASAPAFD